MTSVHVSLGEVAAALGLAALAVVVSAFERARLEREIVVAAARAFVQLTAVGYVVKPFDPIELAGVVRAVLERVARGEREQLNRELSEQE